jgi:hypothetical protein
MSRTAQRRQRKQKKLYQQGVRDGLEHTRDTATETVQEDEEAPTVQGDEDTQPILRDEATATIDKWFDEIVAEETTHWGQQDETEERE